MTDLSRGIIEINGFTFGPNTTLEEVKAFFGNKVRVLELSTGPRLKFDKPFYLTEKIYAYSFNFDFNGQLANFSLIPYVATSNVDANNMTKQMLAISKQWLKTTVALSPVTDCDEGISYHTDVVHISAFVRQDPHYGCVGGEIRVSFQSEV